MVHSDRWSIISVDPLNVEKHGFFCIKNKKADGYKAKLKWFLHQYDLGLRIFIATDASGRQLGFVECIPAEFAWRPLEAEGYLFIQCITVYSKKDRQKGLGRYLLENCERLAQEGEHIGLCSMTSNKPWVAEKGLFEKSGFQKAEELGRFELMYKQLGHSPDLPGLIDWRLQQAKYKGWHLVYADQCPWHKKAVDELAKTAANHGISLQISQLHTPEEAHHAPSGFATFSLLFNGKLLADHYISKTRFLNILNKESY